jgi:hypothetical protein
MAKNENKLKEMESYTGLLRDDFVRVVGDQFIKDINRDIQHALDNFDEQQRTDHGYYTISLKSYPTIKKITWKDAYNHFGTIHHKYTSTIMCESLILPNHDYLDLKNCAIHGMAKMCNPISLLNCCELALWVITFPLCCAYNMSHYINHCSNGYIPLEIKLYLQEKQLI